MNFKIGQNEGVGLFYTMSSIHRIFILTTFEQEGKKKTMKKKEKQKN
jgi:hypothetical protein